MRVGHLAGNGSGRGLYPAVEQRRRGRAGLHRSPRERGRRPPRRRVALSTDRHDWQSAEGLVRGRDLLALVGHPHPDATEARCRPDRSGARSRLRDGMHHAHQARADPGPGLIRSGILRVLRRSRSVAPRPSCRVQDPLRAASHGAPRGRPSRSIVLQHLLQHAQPARGYAASQRVVPLGGVRAELPGALGRILRSAGFRAAPPRVHRGARPGDGRLREAKARRARARTMSDRWAATRVRWLYSYRTLLKYLVLKEIKVKSRGTYLGIGWTLLNPLFTIVVYFVIFRHIFRVAIPDFLGFFLLGFLMWNYFSRSITSAATCVIENESMVKRSVFPLEILALTKVLYNLINYLIALGIALPLLIALWGGKLTWHLLWIVVVTVTFTAFTLAVSFWLATAGVFFRDTRDILEVALPMLFWATPVFYSPEMAPPFMQPILWVNPLTTFLSVMRTAVLDGQRPPIPQVGLTAFWVTAALISSFPVFGRYQPRFAEEL